MRDLCTVGDSISNDPKLFGDSESKLANCGSDDGTKQYARKGYDEYTCDGECGKDRSDISEHRGRS